MISQTHSQVVQTNHPIDWLKAQNQDFNGLSIDEQDAIMHFTLLWSHFEAKVFSTATPSKTSVCSSKILTKTRMWESRGHLRMEPFAPSLAYFRNRYFQLDVVTPNFHGLDFRSNDNQELVEKVIKQKSNDPVDCVAALLIIVYRLRNNLFHGNKWDSNINDQLNNFANANQILMVAFETHQTMSSQ